MSSDRLNVFVSYSHKDKAWLDRVQVHLTPLARDGKLDLWDDTRIRTGQRWREEIKVAVACADVAVLLISADFFASDFIAKNELPPLLEAARSARGLVIAGVHINYSRFDRDEVLSEYQTVNTPDQPIEDLSRAQQEKVFDELARRIEELVPPQPAAPEIPPKYLAWLKRRCAGLELLGQDIQKSHAFTLSHVYVPALTRLTIVTTHSPGVSPSPPEEVWVPLLARIDETSLYVSAPAGAGKSIFCRWAALQSIPGASTSHPVPAPQKYQEEVPESLRTRLPLLIVAPGCGTGSAVIWRRHSPLGSTARRLQT